MPEKKQSRKPQIGVGQFHNCQHEYLEGSCIYCGAISENWQPWKHGDTNPPMRPEILGEGRPKDGVPPKPEAPPEPREYREGPPEPLDSEPSPEPLERNYELEIIARMSQRIAGGRVPYGAFDPNADNRNLATEMLEEIFDALFYAGGLALQLEEMIDND